MPILIFIVFYAKMPQEHNTKGKLGQIGGHEGRSIYNCHLHGVFHYSVAPMVCLSNFLLWVCYYVGDYDD